MPTHEQVISLAIYVYYRALKTTPSLVRQHWESIRDKQLSASVETFTAQHCSQQLLRTELDHVRRAEGSLNDEDMVVKVLSSTNEVKAVVSHDSFPLEMSQQSPDWFNSHA